MKTPDQLAADAAISVAHGLYNRFGNKMGVGLSELRHELQLLESDEHIIKSAIEVALRADERNETRWLSEKETE